MTRISGRQLWLWLGAMALAMCWDRAVYLHLSAHDHDDKMVVESGLLYKVFKELGEIPVWIAVAAAINLIAFFRSRGERERVMLGLRRGLFVLAAAALAGGLAEVGKLMFRRLRPNKTDGWYQFRSFLDQPFKSGGDFPLGLPSSHVAVAFGGAIAVAMLWPRAGRAVCVLAVGTVLARILPGSHFLSDCVLAAFLALVSARIVYPWMLGNQKVSALDER